MGTRFFKKDGSFFNFGDIKKEKLDDVECTLGAFSHASACEEKFLNIFSDTDMRRIFERAGLMERMKSLGYDDIVIDIERDNENIFYLKLYHRAMGAENLLVELRMSERKYSPAKNPISAARHPANLDMIVMEWLSTSSPRGSFSRRRPQLPGQKRPGLGVMGCLFTVMEIMGEEVKRDGVLNVPDHYHNAVIYAKKFRFVDPVHEGVLAALFRDLRGHSLADASWGFATGAVMNAVSGEAVKYEPSEQIFAMSSMMKDYFNSTEYQKNVREASAGRYRLDVRRMKTLRKDLLGRNKPEDL